MAKVKWRQAPKDSPIFLGKVTISSHSRRKREDKNDKLTDEELVEQCRASKEDLERWGLLDRDQLIISTAPRLLNTCDGSAIKAVHTKGR